MIEPFEDVSKRTCADRFGLGIVMEYSNAFFVCLYYDWLTVPVTVVAYYDPLQNDSRVLTKNGDGLKQRCLQLCRQPNS